jgi:hypothetical protein
MLRRQVWLDLAWMFILVTPVVGALLAFFLLLATTMPTPMLKIYQWTVLPGLGLILIRLIFVNFLPYYLPLRRHWINRRLQWFGDPATVAREIDSELAADYCIIRGIIPKWIPWHSISASFTVLTANWFLHFEMFKRIHPRLVAVPLNRIVWIYEQYTVPYDPIRMPAPRHGVALVYDWGAVEVIDWRADGPAKKLAEQLVRRRHELLVGYHGDYIEWRRTDPRRLSQGVHERLLQSASQSPGDLESWVLDQLEDLNKYPRRVDHHLPDTARD